MALKKNVVLKNALKIWLRLLFATFLCGIVHVSVFALGTAAFSEVIGYRIYEIDESGEEQTLVSEHIYQVGEDRNADVKLKDNQTLLQLRETPDNAEVVMSILSSTIMLVIYGIFPYNITWNLGDRIQNKVQYQHETYDSLLGLKVGAVATIPSAVLYVLLVLGKCRVLPDAVLAWHRILNVPFMPYIDAVKNGAMSATELSVGALLAIAAILLVVPALCSIGYFFGYRHISLKEKLIYKNTK